jgi:glycosyltransferase involved in cell wall biosynthesis
MSRALPPSAIKSAVPEAESRDVELTVLMPCLNEAETLAICIDKAHGFLARAGIAGEILIADNGSTDGSVEYALARGARVIAVTERGYGAALRAGIAAARGRFVIVGDADDSYDFSRLDALPPSLSRKSRAEPDRADVLPLRHPRFPLRPAGLAT